MATLTENIDFFQEAVTNLENIASKLSNMPIDRQTIDRITDHELTGIKYWKEINFYNNIISADDDTPVQYFRKFNEVKKIFETFSNKVKEFKDNLIEKKEEVKSTSTVDDPSFLKTNPIIDSRSDEGSSASFMDQKVPPMDQQKFTDVDWNMFIEMQKQFQNQKINQRENKVDAILEMLVQDRAKSFQPNRLRVPELILPEFHGEIKAYKSFKDMFNLAIKDMDLSNTQLFVLLKSKLKGKALETIESLTLNDENYLRAWSALDTCFNNKRRLMDDCFEYVQSLDYKLEHANTDSIVNFHHKFRNLATNFEGLKTTINDWLLRVTLEKLPVIIRENFETFLGTKKQTLPTIDTFTEFMDIQAHVYRGNTAPKDNTYNPKQTSQSTTKIHATMDYADKKPYCLICKGQHFVAECSQFLSSNDQSSLIRHHKVCIYCLRHKFDYKNPCKSRNFLKCDKCLGKHITTR